MISIKLIEKSDIHNLENIGKQSLPIYYDSSNLYHLLYDSNYILLKAVDEINSVIGFVFSKIEDDNVHILSLAIIPNMRNKGIGTKLIDTLKNFKQFTSITLNVLETNTNAINFYYKQNFKKIQVLYKYYSTLNNTNALFLKYTKL